MRLSKAKSRSSRRDDVEMSGSSQSSNVMELTKPVKWQSATWLTSVHFRKLPHPAWKHIQVRRCDDVDVL